MEGKVAKGSDVFSSPVFIRGNWLNRTKEGGGGEPVEGLVVVAKNARINGRGQLCRSFEFRAMFNSMFSGSDALQNAFPIEGKLDGFQSIICSSSNRPV